MKHFHDRGGSLREAGLRSPQSRPARRQLLSPDTSSSSPGPCAGWSLHPIGGRGHKPNQNKLNRPSLILLLYLFLLNVESLYFLRKIVHHLLGSFEDVLSVHFEHNHLKHALCYTCIVKM